MTMARILSYSVPQEDQGKRLDVLCGERGLYASRSAAARAIEQGKVFVNGSVTTKKHAVDAGDTIVYTLEDEAVSTLPMGQLIELDIRYEDEYLLVISKQAGLVCHPSVDHHDATLVNALIYHCGIDNLCNVQGEDDRLGIVHRLDQDTSGLMLAAKTDEVGYALMEDIRNRSVERYYLTLVHGNIVHDSGMVDAPLSRSAKERTRMAVRDTDSSREAVTTFRVLERFGAGEGDDGYSLLECKLFTGRTHQIRVHMQYIKHACVGDPLYGSGDSGAQLGLKRQFLHSYRLGFTHPITGREMRYVDKLPHDLAEALAGLRDRSLGRTEAGDEVFTRIEKEGA